MKPLRDRLAHAARSGGVALPVVEKDYALSYVLAGIATVPALSESLVFKGGTALKKAYFGDYRSPRTWTSPPVRGRCARRWTRP